MKIYLTKTINGLVGIPPTEDEYYNLKNGKIYNCEIKAERKSWRHRKFFSLMKIAAENSQAGDYTVEQLREMVLVGIGHCTTYIDYLGNTINKAKSISYSSVDDIKFEAIYNQSVDFILKYILIGSTEEEVETAIKVATDY